MVISASELGIHWVQFFLLLPSGLVPFMNRFHVILLLSTSFLWVSPTRRETVPGSQDALKELTKPGKSFSCCHSNYTDWNTAGHPAHSGTFIPVLVAGDPVGDVGDSLSVALFVSEAAREHDELPL